MVTLLLTQMFLPDASVDVAAGEPGTTQRPNIVLIVTDDQTLENQRVLRYVNDRLGDRGTTFMNAVASFPLCCPSRASILTGQYAHNHGVRGNGWPSGGYEKLDHSNTLATWLDAAGYHTAFIGKYLNEYGLFRPPRVPPGWDEWFAKIGEGDQYYGYDVLDDGQVRHYGEAADHYSTDVYAREALAVIRSRAPTDRPFFLQVSVAAPHISENEPIPAPRHVGTYETEPLPTPPSFNEEDLSDKPANVQDNRVLSGRQIDRIETRYRRRLESLLAVDELVQTLVSAVEDSLESENTLFIFMSDNGYLEGQHRIPLGKGPVYEESIRVPLIVSGPGFPAGSRVWAPVANIDIAPTIVAAAGAQSERTMDGIPLQQVAAEPERYAQRRILLENFGGALWTAVRERRWIYVEHNNGEEELYDLRTDPYQLESLHDDPTRAEVREDLAAELRLLRRCAGSSCHLP